MATSVRPTDVSGLLQTLGAAARFRTFIAAVAAAGLTQELSRGDTTVFAPSDWAFERLPSGVLREMFGSPERLRALLEGHIVAGVYPERDLIPFTRLSTAAGTVLRLTIGETDREILVDGIGIVTTDILTADGVVHELDGVVGISAHNAPADAPSGRNGRWRTIQESPVDVAEGLGPRHQPEPALPE